MVRVATNVSILDLVQAILAERDLEARQLMGVWLVLKATASILGWIPTCS